MAILLILFFNSEYNYYTVMCTLNENVQIKKYVQTGMENWTVFLFFPLIDDYNLHNIRGVSFPLCGIKSRNAVFIIS